MSLAPLTSYSLLSIVALAGPQRQANSVSALHRLVRCGGAVKGFSKTACIFLVFFATVIASPAQTFKPLASFDDSNGSGPQALVQGTDGNFYGTAYWGGAFTCVNPEGCGTVFKITSGGVLTTLYSFCAQTNCTDGAAPNAPLVQGADGSFYGTTSVGGTSTACDLGCGTVFKILPNGAFLTLYDFDGTDDGEYPSGGLVQGTDGNFYGTTGGGTSNDGTVFKISLGGTLTTLHTFDYEDGSGPYGALVQGIDGSFYGTTSDGGTNMCGRGGCGTVFKISSGGTFVSLHSFNDTDGDGYFPSGGLVQAVNGKFYGTTGGGGAYDYGTVFKITPGGVLTTFYSFCFQKCGDGPAGPTGLMQATDGNFYGTTCCGGTHEEGTVFRITSGGELTILHSFFNCPPKGGKCGGRSPSGPLLQATDGNFYGTAEGGGPNHGCGPVGCGIVFSLSVGLGPFVETRPTSGKIGAPVVILGTNLSGATSVTFNGTVAKFTVVSKSEIKTTVPEGAITGKIEVTTPRGTLKSNVLFRVTK
jgi:uncharacterized repeat protein (TIGR03803 family)